jgi:hypothetical protein
MPQEYDIVGGLISEQALKDVEKLSALYASAAENATKLIAAANKTASQIDKKALMAEKLAALEQKTAEAKNRAAVAEEKRNTELLRAQRLQQLMDNQQTAAEAKRAKAVQDQTGYLNSLKAQVKDLTDQYMRLSEAEYKNAKNGTANTLGNEVITNLKKQRQELALAEQAYGNYKMSVGNYSSANKMFGINIGQVLKEIPNFAISARIGIMSLTNNLPMLAESFAAVRREQKEMRAEQLAAVAAGKMQASEMTKMPSVLKMVAQGIFGLTGMMSILMVVMQAFGPAVIDWIGSLGSANTELEIIKKAHEDFLESLKKGTGEFSTATKSFQELSAIVEAGSRGFISQKDVIDEYNKVFGATNGYVKTFEEAQKRMSEQAPNYVQAMGMMALANAFLAESVKKAGEAEAERANKNVNLWDKISFMARNIFDNDMKNLATKEGYEKAVLAERKKNSEKASEDSKTLFQKYKDQYADFAKFAKDNGIDVWGDQNKPKNGKVSTTVQTAQIKLIQEEYYSKERAKLINKMSDLEIQTAKVTDKGIINGYEDRLNAARNYFTSAASVAGIDNAKELFDADQKMGIGNAEIEKIRAANRKKLSEKKITEKEFQNSEIENGKALKTLVNNYETDILQAKDKFNKTILSEQIKFNKTNYQIWQDRYTEEVNLLKISQEEKATLIEQEGRRRQNEAKKQGVGGAFYQAFTGKALDTSNAEIEAERKTSQEKLANEKQTIISSLALAKNGSEEQKKILLDLEEFRRKEAKETADYKLKLQEDSDKKLADLQFSTAKTVTEVLGKLWSNYYANQEYSINKETEVFKAQETEKGKDVEDRLKAGVITSKEAEDEKARIKDYYDAAYKEQERKKQELEVQKFYVDQAMSIARIAMSTGEAIMKAVASGYGAALTPWILGLAGAQTALVLAQQPPKFAKGGIMPYDGMAEVGDGGKHELWVSPDGKMGITPNTPTFMNLDKGTKIYPDINKIDLMSIIGISRTSDSAYDMKRLEKVMQSIDRKVGGKNQTTLKGMTLVEQFNQSEKLKGKTRSLMN